jgi:hypothetical protein
MKKFCLIFISILLFSFSVSAQMPDTAKLEKQRAELKKLDFLVGTWEGTGWMQIGRERKNATIREVVQPKVGGLIYVVEGIGKNKDEKTGEERVIHNAYGIFYVDDQTGKLSFRFYKENGQTGETPVEVSGTKVVWGFTTQPGNVQVRFTEELNDKGEWTEFGEVFVNEKWMRFLEMKLRKVN